MTNPSPPTQSEGQKTIVVTGASSGFGALASRALAQAGHTVYAGIRDTAGRNAPAVTDLAKWATDRGVDLRPVDLDVTAQASVDSAIAQVIVEQGRLDVIVHNAGHMVLGPAAAFTPEQYANVFDINVLGAQRVNRAALPHLRAQGSGFVMVLVEEVADGGWGRADETVTLAKMGLTPAGGARTG
ncbi:MAG TPA: SDR family NAD(P)-dependent oxidoreductase [Acidimicrobiales bacterium]|nr:SDR family NAD(P)-dependent oxidoreductase [Acidimicrobiales bacterium]